MDISRLKSLRAVNRAAVTKILKKMDDATSDYIGESILDTAITEEISSLLETIEKKKTTLGTLAEQLLSNTHSDDVENEIIETDEYYIELENKIRQFRKYLKPTSTSSSSVLRSNAPEFIPHPSYYQKLSQSSSTSSQNHRLPKLSLPNFRGDILEWQYFWDSFESTVHLNHTLTEVQKYSYLKSLLQYEAANVISGLTMTNVNYHKAVELLKNRYGQTHKITNAYMRALLDIPAPGEHIDSLRSFYDNSEAYIRGLESLGQCQEMFGSLLIPVILGKLPSEFRKQIKRENGNDNWNIQKLRDAICKELLIQESDQIDYNSYKRTTSTANFVAGVKKDFPRNRQVKPAKFHNQRGLMNQKKSCVYCEGNHSSNKCRDIVDHEKRIAIIKEKKLCFNCFGAHRVSECKSRFDCRNCHRKHHTSLCQRSNDRKPELESKKDKSEASMLYTSANQETSNVLLKTAVAQVMSNQNETEANILFYEGAQRSFITQGLATKLNAKTEASEALNISSFGDQAKGVRNLDRIAVQLRATNGEIIPLKVLVVPTIASPLQNRSRKVTQKLHYLRGLSLAHPVTDAESFEISLLIGADFYWNIVQDHVIRGNGPTAVSSKLGYLLSGPVPATTRNQSTSTMNVLIAHKDTEYDLEKFWKLENMGINSKELDTNTELTCAMENYIETSISKENGK